MNKYTDNGKLPPSGIAIEEIVLGCILYDKEIHDDVIGLLKREYFYKESNALVFEAMQSMYNSSQPIDIITVTSELRKTGKLEEVGGAMAVTSLTDRIGTTSHVQRYCKLLELLSMKRSLIDLSHHLSSAAYETDSDPYKLIELYDTKLLNIAEQVSQDSPTTVFTDLASEAFSIEKNMQDGDVMTGIPSGFTKLDRITGGFKGGQKITIAGRPSSGKSSLAVRIALNIIKWFNSRKEDKAVVIFSLEVNKMEVAFKVVSMEAKIQTADMDRGNVSDEENQRIYKALNDISGELLYVNDGFHVNALSMRRELKKIAKKHKGGIGMVVVDYLQLMESSEYTGNREQEISKISRSLKGLAKEFDCPVMDLSQLNRGCESRPDKKPKLSDLRESGSIEQDADIAILVFRPEMYFQVDENGESTKGKATLIVAKNKNGQLAEIDVHYESRFTNFTESPPPLSFQAEFDTQTHQIKPNHDDFGVF